MTCIKCHRKVAKVFAIFVIDYNNDNNNDNNNGTFIRHIHKKKLKEK